MKLLQPSLQRLAVVAVVSGCVGQAAAQSGVASAADPLQNEAAPMPMQAVPGEAATPAAAPPQQRAPQPARQRARAVVDRQNHRGRDEAEDDQRGGKEGHCHPREREGPESDAAARWLARFGHAAARRAGSSLSRG